MGGGAVGRVLFRLHDADCYPPHHDQWEEVAGEPHLLNSGFSHYPGIDPESAIARFYGPMGTDADLANDEYPVAVWLWLTTAYEWVEVTDRVVVNMRATNGNLTPRDIEIHGNGTLLPPGFYAMTAILDGPDRLYCEGTFADPDSEPPPQWNIEYMSQTRVEYHFRLYQDCDLNGLEDEFELPQPPTCHGDRCPADVDDGTGSGLPDGGVTIEDLLYYLDIFDEGLSRADFDDGTSTGTPDGGVTIDDLLFFLLHFDLGC